MTAHFLRALFSILVLLLFEVNLPPKHSAVHGRALTCSGKAERGGTAQQHRRAFVDLRCSNNTQFCVAQTGTVQRVVPHVINFTEHHTIYDCYDESHRDLLASYLHVPRERQPDTAGCYRFHYAVPQIIANVDMCLCAGDWCNINFSSVMTVGKKPELFDDYLEKNAKQEEMQAAVNSTIILHNTTLSTTQSRRNAASLVISRSAYPMPPPTATFKLPLLGNESEPPPSTNSSNGDTSDRLVCAAKGLSATISTLCDDNVSTLECPADVDQCLVLQGQFAATPSEDAAAYDDSQPDSNMLQFSERTCAFPTWLEVFYDFYGITLDNLPYNACMTLKGSRKHKINATLCTCTSGMCNRFDAQVLHLGRSQLDLCSEHEHLILEAADGQLTLANVAVVRQSKNKAAFPEAVATNTAVASLIHISFAVYLLMLLDFLLP